MHWITEKSNISMIAYWTLKLLLTKKAEKMDMKDDGDFVATAPVAEENGDNKAEEIYVFKELGEEQGEEQPMSSFVTKHRDTGSAST